MECVAALRRAVEESPKAALLPGGAAGVCKFDALRDIDAAISSATNDPPAPSPSPSPSPSPTPTPSPSLPATPASPAPQRPPQPTSTAATTTTTTSTSTPGGGGGGSARVSGSGSGSGSATTVPSTAQLKAGSGELVQLLMACVMQPLSPPHCKVVSHIIVTLAEKTREGGLCGKVVRHLTSVVLAGRGPPHSKIAAFEIIGQLFCSKGCELIPTVTELDAQISKHLKAQDASVKEAALVALSGVLQGCGMNVSQLVSDVLKTLKKIIQDKSPDVRLRAAQCLANLCKIPCDYPTYETRLLMCSKLMEDTMDVVREEGALAASILLKNPQKPVVATSKNPREPPKNPGLPSTPRESLTMALTVLSGIFLKATKKEVRTAAISVFTKMAKELTSAEIDPNMDLIVSSLVKLVRNKSAFPTSSEALQACACVSFALSSFADCLREVQQLKMVRILSKELTREKEAQELAQLALLRVLSGVILQVGESGADMVEWLSEPICSLLASSYATVRTQAACCLRALGHALPSQLASLLRSTIEHTSQLKAPTTNTSELPQYAATIRGYAAAISALLAEVPVASSLGIPDAIVRAALDLTQQLREASHSDQRVAEAQCEASWRILASLVSSLGSFYSKQFSAQTASSIAASLGGAPVAPQSQVDQPAYVQAKLGSLWALTAIEETCPELTVEHTLSLLHQPIVETVNVAASLIPASSDYVLLLMLNVMRSLAASSTQKLHSVCEASSTKLIVYSLNDGLPCSMLQRLLRSDDSALGPWPESDENLTELNGMFSNEISDAPALWNASRDLALNQPLPLSLQVADAAIKLIQQIAMCQGVDLHKLLLRIDAIARNITPGAQGGAQFNAIAALLAVCRTIDEKRVHARAESITLIVNCARTLIGHLDPAVRRGSAEVIGIVCRLAGDQFTATMVQSLFQTIKETKEDPLKAGCSFAIGCVLRYVGGMRASQHLPLLVPLLHALAQSPVVLVHTWALHSLCLAIEAAGPSYPAEQTLSVLKHMFSSPAHTSGMASIRSVGRVMNAIVGSVGPDLQPESSIFRACTAILAEVKSFHHPLVQLESIRFYQRLILFARQAVIPSTFTPFLHQQLVSPFLVVRQATVTCFRQLIQASGNWDLGVPGISLAKQLFSMLDYESDRKLLAEGELVLSTMIEVLSPSAPAQWLYMLKDIVLTTHSTSKGQVAQVKKVHEETGEDEDEPEPESVQPQSIMTEDDIKDLTGPQNELVPRWRTKVFAIELLCKLISTTRALPNYEPHFDLILAQAKASNCESNQPNSGTASTSTTSSTQQQNMWLVFGLPDLVKVVFFAATSQTEPLRPAGVKLMLDVVKNFANARDPQLEDHSLLELHQVQFTSGLHRAFTPDAPPSATAAACQVLVGFVIAGVCSDPADVRRLLSLVIGYVDSIRTLSYPMYSERAATMVQLEVLSAVAHLHLLGSGRIGHVQSGIATTITEMIEPLLPSLSLLWQDILRDHAVLATQPPAVLLVYSGVFFTFQSALEVKQYYSTAWVYVLRALASLVGTRHLLVVGGNKSELDAFNVMLGLAVPVLRDLRDPNSVIHALHSMRDLLCQQIVCFDPKTANKERNETETSALSTPGSVADSEGPLFNEGLLLELLLCCRRHIEDGNVSTHEPAALLLQHLASVLPSTYFSELEKCADEEQPSIDGGNSSTQSSQLYFTFHQILQLSLSPIHTLCNNKTGLGNSTQETALVQQLCCVSLDTIATLAQRLMPPRVRMNYLPSLLMLFLSILKAPTTTPKVVSAAIQSLRITATPPVFEVEDNYTNWEDILQRAMGTILNTILPQESTPLESPIGSACFTALVSLFGLLKHRNPNSEIHSACCTAIKTAMTSGAPSLTLTALQCVQSLLKSSIAGAATAKTLALQYTRCILPEVIALINKYSLQSQQDYSSHQLEHLTEAIKILVLVHTLADQNQKVIMLRIVLPALFWLLKPTSKPSSNIRAIHSTALQVVLHLASTCAIEFKQFVDSLALEEKSLVETRLRQSVEETNAPSTTTTTSQATTQQTPQAAPRNMKLDLSKWNS